MKIILISDVPPDSTFTGGQVLEKIVQELPQYQWTFYWLNQSNLTSPASALEASFYNNFHLGQSATVWQNRFYKLTFGVNRAKRLIDTLFRIAKAVQVGILTAKKINASDCDYVWTVLQGEMLAITYNTIQLFTKKKIILHQWDPISWWSAHRGHGKIKGSFANILVSRLEDKAFLNIIPSKPWQELHQKRDRATHKIDNFFTLKDLLAKPTDRPEHLSKSEIHAVFIGQLYSNDELKDLLGILNQHAKKTTKKIVLHYFGGGQPDFNFDSVTVTHHGFVSRKELISTIGQWDFALLPYPTAEKFKMASQYSFPSKSRVYLASGLPILAYAKVNSSPHLFYSQTMPDFYQNALDEKGDLEKFIQAATDRSSEATEIRFSKIASVLKENFSQEAELDPLKEILQKHLK